LIDDVLGRVSGGEDLSLDEMTDVVSAVMRGAWQERQIMLLLNALRLKGETIDEIAGAALAMRRHMTPVRTQRTDVMDTCGTGGVGSEAMNVSTGAAIVAAAAGVAVAKHGNRSVTSKSGSADVLKQLGVNIEAPMETVERCLDELGICFCFAPRFHPAMRHVASARKNLGGRTIFNLLGPLCNPASAPCQLLGVGAPELRDKLAGALTRLNTRRAVVVTGDDGMGEVTLFAPTRATVLDGSARRDETWHPEDFGLHTRDAGERQAIRVDGPADSAAMIRRVLDGDAGPPRDIVVLNAAAALWTAGLSRDLVQCAQRSAAAIDSGAARGLLSRLVEYSQT
jgi:anthranilate phosphoribosyltransferase